MKQSAALFVSGEFFIELCKHGQSRMVTVDRALPEDAELVRIFPHRYGVGIEISSASFPPEGAEIDEDSGLPIVEPKFTVVTEPLLPLTAEISEANIGPNDVLVVTSPGLLSSDMADRIRKYLEETWPGRKAIVLSDGLKLSIVRQQAVTDSGP